MSCLAVSEILPLLSSLSFSSVQEMMGSNSDIIHAKI